MRLFSKENDVIHRILNLILVLWFVIAIFIFYGNLIDILVKEPIETYEEYVDKGCPYVYIRNGDRDYSLKTDVESVNEDEPEVDEETICKGYYEAYKFEYDSKFNEVEDLLYAAGNMVIVGAFLFILNKKQTK